jgi:protein AATF/BFR2
VKKAQSSVAGVLDELLELQFSLINRDDSLKKAVKRRSDDDSEDDEMSTSNVTPPGKKLKIAEYSAELERIHNAMVPYRNETIEKWNDKTRLATGRSSSSKSFSGFETSVLRQIEQILSDRTRLVARTRTKRSTYRVLGSKEAADEPGDDVNEEQVQDPEVFDDDDFYHQLLRELIDRKSADLTDPTQLGKHWLQIQKMRSKMKRKAGVDTKAR